MTTAEAAAVPANYSDRVRGSIDALARFGVTEEQIRVRANLSPVEWERFKASPEGMSTIELVSLAEALFVDIAYLVTGDSRYMVTFSAHSWTSVLRSSYPEIEA
jgi:hypothetical protein